MLQLLFNYLFPDKPKHSKQKNMMKTWPQLVNSESKIELTADFPPLTRSTIYTLEVNVHSDPVALALLHLLSSKGQCMCVSVAGLHNVLSALHALPSGLSGSEGIAQEVEVTWHHPRNAGLWVEGSGHTSFQRPSVSQTAWFEAATPRFVMSTGPWETRRWHRLLQIHSESLKSWTLYR